SAVAGNHVFTQLSAGAGDSCAVDMNGKAWGWGQNSDLGRLGNGAIDDSRTPSAVAGGLTFATISAGDGHTRGLTAQGEAWCWGANFSGELGRGPGTGLGDSSTVSSAVPVRVAGGLSFRTIGVRSSASCALTAGGSAYCWGGASAVPQDVSNGL